MIGKWAILALLGGYLMACNVAGGVEDLPVVCQDKMGAIACEELGAERVREAVLENAIVRIRYKWEIVFGGEAEVRLENSKMVRVLCGVREAGFEADSYRVEAWIDVSDGNGNVWEERGIATTLNREELGAINCGNVDGVRLEAVGSYVLHRLLQ